MKRLILSITIVLSGLLCTQAFAQEGSLRDRLAKKQAQTKKQQSLPELSIRAQNMNASQTQNINDVPWMREIYRFVDLNKDKNASLYYPSMPIGDRMNLFTMMFKLMANGEISGYEYLIDGREIFTEEYALKFVDLLNRFSIMYTEENGRYIVEDSDIPSNEVMGYYVKEAWYFDKSNSVVDVKILAICPVVFRQDDFDVETTRYPLFWMPYEEIRPYASRMSIMTSNLNNASNQTIDDFFRKHSFEGEIYKTTNLRNISLAQAFPNDSLRKKEEKKIETQLKDFKTRLWAVNDSVALKGEDAKKVKQKEAKTYKAEVRTNEDLEEKEQKANTAVGTVKAGKGSKSSSSKQPVRSMRNRNRR